MKAPGVFTILALIALSAIAGAWWQFERDRNVPPRITVTIVERPVEIPPAVTTKTAPKPAAPKPEESVRIDSLIERAKRADALEDSLRTIAQPFETVHTGRIETSDSLGSFSAERIDTVRSFPPDRKATVTTTYQNARLTTTNREEERVLPEEESWTEDVKDALAVVGWMVLALKLLGVF